MNIVLIGMSGCGKSEIAKKLGLEIGKQVLDTDREIINEMNMPINEIFAQKGEAFFRQAEARVCQRVAAQKGVIISTGGGAILNEDNIKALKQGGVLFFINRDPELIFSTANRQVRPMLQDKEKFLQIYNQRLEKYQRAADYIIDNNGKMESAVEAIISVYAELCQNQGFKP